MKVDVNHVVSLISSMTTKIENDIKKQVKRATDHLKPDPATI